MGLIHSRAAKKRDREEAKLLKTQRKTLEHDKQAAGAQTGEGKPWHEQKTLGGAIKAAAAKAAEKRADGSR
jgi:hypothetical protein